MDAEWILSPLWGSKNPG